MQNILILLSLILIINFILFKNNNLIAKKINLFDNPNTKRKIHIKNTPLNGGLFYFFNILLIFLFDYNFNDSVISLFFGLDNFSNIIFFLLIVFFLLLIGIIDDKLSLKPITKTFASIIIFSIFLVLNKDFIIIEFHFSSFDKVIDLFEVSLTFTIVCFTVLQIILNMYDGINLQSSLYYGIITIFFLVVTPNLGLKLFCLITLIYLFIFSIYNYKGLIFFGDNGVYVYSFILSLIIMKTYNTSTIINVENILILLLYPTLDTIRLFFSRLKENQNPFEGDRNHIHHILYDRYGLIIANLILALTLSTSIILVYVLKVNPLLVILFSSAIYLKLIMKKNKIVK